MRCWERRALRTPVGRDPAADGQPGRHPGFGPTDAELPIIAVTASVTLKFGETLVLSGLSEKENETIKSEVPLLKDIPGLQCAFSREDTVEITKSILILLTPRQPRYTFQDGIERRDAGTKNAGAKGPAPGKNLEELKSRADWFQPAPNLDAVFRHLSRKENFKEYRAGDVKLERWDAPDDLIVMIERTLNFLYY